MESLKQVSTYKQKGIVSGSIGRSDLSFCYWFSGKISRKLQYSFKTEVEPKYRNIFNSKLMHQECTYSSVKNAIPAYVCLQTIQEIIN